LRRYLAPTRDRCCGSYPHCAASPSGVGQTNFHPYPRGYGHAAVYSLYPHSHVAPANATSVYPYSAAHFAYSRHIHPGCTFGYAYAVQYSRYPNFNRPAYSYIRITCCPNLNQSAYSYIRITAINRHYCPNSYPHSNRHIHTNGYGYGYTHSNPYSYTHRYSYANIYPNPPARSINQRCQRVRGRCRPGQCHLHRLPLGCQWPDRHRQLRHRRQHRHQPG
jgi:hypothetical protein